MDAGRDGVRGHTGPCPERQRGTQKVDPPLHPGGERVHHRLKCAAGHRLRRPTQRMTRLVDNRDAAWTSHLNPPPLDEAGNSVKAQKVIEYVANKLDFNLFSPRSVGLKTE